MEVLQVTMLGEFSIHRGEYCINDSSNRMRKVWLLLAYLIYTRNSRTTQNHFLSLLRGAGNEEIDDPSGRLKALFYRVRTQLNQLGDSVGHTLILHKNGVYGWNAAAPLELDVEVFERLCKEAAAAQSPEEQLTLYQKALALYHGDFLPKLSMEPWVMPLSAYYHQMFVQAAQQAAALLIGQKQWQEADRLCDQALVIEPYSEELYQQKMRCCLGLSDRSKAAVAFEKMSQMLFDNFGVMPSDESRALYREACKESNNHAASITTVREQLQEVGSANGALFCEFDFFRLLYQVQARAIARSGDVIHIALLSCMGENDKPLSRRSLDTAMDNLQALVLGNLRQGDVVTRYSASQLCCMLPHADYENSCKVCQRIIKAFFRQYPHSPAKIHYRVQPLEPMGQIR